MSAPEPQWIVEPDVADLLGRALLFAAGEEAGGTSVESLEDDERRRMVEAGRELRARAVGSEPAPVEDPEPLLSALNDGSLRPEMFRLADDTIEARLTVEPDVAFLLLRRRSDATAADETGAGQ